MAAFTPWHLQDRKQAKGAVGSIRHWIFSVYFTNRLFDIYSSLGNILISLKSKIYELKMEKSKWKRPNPDRRIIIKDGCNDVQCVNYCCPHSIVSESESMEINSMERDDCERNKRGTWQCDKLFGGRATRSEHLTESVCMRLGGDDDEAHGKQ